MGFGHRVYHNYDPRAKIIQRTAYEVFKIVGREPLVSMLFLLFGLCVYKCALRAHVFALVYHNYDHAREDQPACACFRESYVS